jgi:uncharacterized membrane protein
VKFFARVVLALLLLTAGTLHLWKPEPFLRIVPSYLPAPRALVTVSGVVELLCGLGLLIPAIIPWAAWASVALFIAVFPANLYMATHHIRFAGIPDSPWVYWGRLPLQLLLIAWASWFTRR